MRLHTWQGKTLLTGLVVVATGRVRADDWPQWLGPQRDGVWRESGIVEKFPASGPKVKWQKPIGGGYAGPAVAGGKVFVTDRVLAPGAKNPDSPFNKKRTIGRREPLLCLHQAHRSVLLEYKYHCPYLRLTPPPGPPTAPPI